MTCPLTTGIFLRIVAEAAEEQLAEGRRPVAPYWRVVPESGLLNPKYPAGGRAQAGHLKREGWVVEGGKGGVRLIGRRGSGRRA